MFESSFRARLTRIPFLLLGALALAAMTTVHAAEPAKDKTFGKTRPAGALLNRAELRECMAAQERMRVRREDLARQQEQLAKDKEELTRSGAELKETLAGLDRTSQEQVEKYAAQATARDKMIDAYEARTTDYNTQVDALKTDRDAYGRSCENRRFDEKDETAIKNGK